MMVEMRHSANFPQISFDFKLDAYLAGFVHEWDVEDVDGAKCPGLSSGETLHDLIPSGSVVFLQDATGRAPQEDPDATYMNPTWVSNALLWVWDGESEPVNVNDQLLRSGYGVYSEADTPAEWRAKFKLAGKTAQAGGVGIWGESGPPAGPTCRALPPHMNRRLQRSCIDKW